MKNVPKIYKRIFIISFIIVAVLTSLTILSRTTLPIGPGEQPVFSDYLYAIIIACLQILLVLIIFSIALSLLLLWIWSLIDIIKADPTIKKNKGLWMVIIIIIPGIGALLYLFLNSRSST